MTTILTRLPDERCVLATTTLFAGMFPITRPGERVARDSWIVRERPADFVEITRGVSPERAMACIIAIDIPKPDGQAWQLTRVAWVSQWFDIDDPIVVAYPDRFGPLDGA